MALTSKKYSAVHSKTGSDKTTLKTNFDDGHINTFVDLADNGTNPEFGALIYQIQEMQDELDYLRTEISTNKDKNGISTSQASAITANTAKTGITNSQSTMITDNMTEAKRLGGLIDTNTRSTTNNASTISNLINNKLEIIPNRNGSVKQGLTCGVVERLGVYMLNFAYEDVDKAGKTITKTGSIQLK